jgi:Flp pilus assembly protein TadG
MRGDTTMNKGTHVDCAAKGRLAMLAALMHRRKGAGRAQSAVEFAIALPVVLMTLLVGIQYAIIGAAALALGQVNYQGARYAAINTSKTQDEVTSYMLSVASPTISQNNGQYLTVNLSPAPPCAFGTSITLALTFDTSNLLALPNPFFGINFPTQLTSSESAFCEGSTN